MWKVIVGEWKGNTKQLAKSLLPCLGYMAACVLLLAAWVSFFLAVVVMGTVVQNDVFDVQIGGRELTGIVLPGIFFAADLFFYLMLRRKPIRLPKMLWLVPAGRARKLEYLKKKFWIKMVWCFLFLLLWQWLCLANNHPVYRLTPLEQGGFLFLGFFTIWAMILKAGIGRFPGKERNQKETLVQLYWILFLLAQQLFFGISVIGNWMEEYPLSILVFAAVFLADWQMGRTAAKYVMEQALSYEKVYGPADSL